MYLIHPRLLDLSPTHESDQDRILDRIEFWIVSPLRPYTFFDRITLGSDPIVVIISSKLRT